MIGGMVTVVGEGAVGLTGVTLGGKSGTDGGRDSGLLVGATIGSGAVDGTLGGGTEIDGDCWEVSLDDVADDEGEKCHFC